MNVCADALIVVCAQVRWYRDTMLLDRNERRIMEQFGQRHRLVLTSLLMEDFANYSCYAENDLGRARQFIQLAGGESGSSCSQYP